MEDVWLSPPVEMQVPPIVFDQQFGRWLKEHVVQTHLFVFARADELVEVRWAISMVLFAVGLSGSLWFGRTRGCGMCLRQLGHSWSIMAIQFSWSW